MQPIFWYIGDQSVQHAATCAAGAAIVWTFVRPGKKKEGVVAMTTPVVGARGGAAVRDGPGRLEGRGLRLF